MNFFPDSQARIFWMLRQWLCGLTIILLLLAGCGATKVGNIRSELDNYEGQQVTISGKVVETLSVPFVHKGAYQSDSRSNRCEEGNCYTDLKPNAAKNCRSNNTGMNPRAERAKHIRAEASPSGFALLAPMFTCLRATHRQASGLFPRHLDWRHQNEFLVALI